MKRLISCFCMMLLLTACTGERAVQPSPTPEQTNTPAPTPAVAFGAPVWGTAEYDLIKTDDETDDTLMTAKYILPAITNEPSAPQWAAINEYYTAEGETLLQQAEQSADIAQENYDYYKAAEYEFYPHSDEQNYEIKLNTEPYVSILRTHYGYSGGAHGEVYLLSDTFDMDTGTRMQLDELFTVSSAEYEERVLTEVNKLAALMVTSDGEPLLDESALESTFDHNCFYLTEDALVIYYQTYSLGCHALGAPEFPISCEALEDILIEW